MSKNIQLDVAPRGTYTALGFRAARTATVYGRSPVGASAAQHEQYDRVRLINQSREFMRDNGIYHGMIERAVGYIIGDGFKVQAKTKSAKWNQDAEALWRDFWRRPEVKMIQSGRRVERMVARELLVAGDTGAIKTRAKGRIQIIEAEQVAGPQMKDDGVKTDSNGTPYKFYICPYRNGRVDLNSAKTYTPDEFLFMTDPQRPSGIRAVPPCQAAFPMLHRINDVCDAEAIAWQLLARMAVAITQPDADIEAYNSSAEDPIKGSDTDGDLATRVTEMDYAMIFHGAPGDNIAGIDRNIPGKDFPQSLLMFLRLLGLPLGLPLEVILLDWTKSNYSQSRAVLEQAYQVFLGWQLLIEDFFHRPIYEWKIRQWINEGKLGKRKDSLAHEWIKPTFPWIDQLKEAQAYGAKLDRGFATHGQVCKSLNADRDDIVAAREAEVLDAIERAQKIEKATGKEVPWEIFCGLEHSMSKTEPREPHNPAKDDQNGDE